MNAVERAVAVANGFAFKRGEYAEATRQLKTFADLYASLDPAQAHAVRQTFDPKQRLGWLVVATGLIRHGFSDAKRDERAELIHIFVAMFSCDNLDFGYDSLLQVDSARKILGDSRDLIKESWNHFAHLTENKLARSNFENKFSLF